MIDAPDMAKPAETSTILTRRGLIPDPERKGVFRQPFSTSVVTTDGALVPWLASRGPLSYRPEQPPERDYFFQYGWILPDVISAQVNARKHFYFGNACRDSARDLFSFWKSARSRRIDPVAVHFGQFDPRIHIRAPIAIYRHTRYFSDEPHYLLIQHGSYQLITAKEQPEIKGGFFRIYRGIQQSRNFRYIQFDPLKLVGKNRTAWNAYLLTQAQVLSDSGLSFLSIHDRAVRCETEHLKDRSWVTDELGKMNGLHDLEKPRSFAAELWRATHQSFTLERWVAERKFGPNFIEARTPISNVRLTTFFAGEAEVRIIDPNLVEFTGSKGCEIDLNVFPKEQSE